MAKLSEMEKKYDNCSSSLSVYQRTDYFNIWADFWRYIIGVNVIPANTRKKIITISWKQYQNTPIAEEVHAAWKNRGAFNDGMAIIAGKVWHNYEKKDLYLIQLDLDNSKAILEFSTRNRKSTTFGDLAKHMIIEQHMDDPNKAHVLFYATHPFPKKSSDVAKLSELLKHDEIPAIEIKGAGEHGVLFCTPSPHKNGKSYEIIGTKEPEIIDEMETHLHDILKKYSIEYPANNNNNVSNQLENRANLPPMKDLFRPGIMILKGQNRHEALMRVMESLILRNQNILSQETIKGFAEKWNSETCEPPLDKREFQKQWKAALKFTDMINKQRALDQSQLEERRKRKLAEEELTKSEEQKNEKKNPLRIGVLARLNEEGINHYGYGQLSSLGALYKRVHAAHLQCQRCCREKEIVFEHPKTRQFFFSNFEFAELCMTRFAEDNNDCNGIIKIEPKWVNALDIEVSDVSSLQDIDRLKCVLLGDDTKDVGIGENVIVFGSIYMEGVKNGPTFPVLYVQSIKYEGREQEGLTNLDIQGIRRFRERFPDDQVYFKKLVSMTACDIIGLDDIKEGILYMVSRAKADSPKKRGRIHAVIISLPGEAKTALLNYATELMDRSTFETAQLSTGLSLIALVESIGDMKILRLGPVSTSMLACIDEFNRMSGSDQEKFFGVMEEGKTTTVKFGRKVKITAPVTILASINPPEGTDYYDSQGNIDLQSMNIIAPIQSRFDLKFYISPKKNEEEIRQIVEVKADMESRESGVPNYSRFIKKLMIYIKRYHGDPRLTGEALSIINEAYLELKINDVYNNVSLRVYNLLVNLAKARAMLLLKEMVDSEIAKSAVEYYSKISQNYLGRAIQPRDPIEEAILECKKFLSDPVHQNGFGFTESQLLENVCQINHQVDRYIKSGVSKMDYFDKSNNKRARYILERLRVRYSEITVISKRPVILKWIPKLQFKKETDSDLSDFADHGKDVFNKNMCNSTAEKTNQKNDTVKSEHNKINNEFSGPLLNESRKSERSTSAYSGYAYCCYICIKKQKSRFETNSKSEYQGHYTLKHPGMTAYPGIADLELYGWEPQDREWEV